MWTSVKASIEKLFGARRAEQGRNDRGADGTGLNGYGKSRREFLAGMGLAGAVAVAGPMLLAPGRVEADIIDDLVGDDASAAAEPDIELAQRRDRRGRRRRGRRRRGRGRRRMSARELRRRCRRDRRFRRRNRRLCERATGWRGRRGACIQIGPVEICE